MLSPPPGVRRTHRGNSPQTLWVWICSARGPTQKPHESSGVKLCHSTKGFGLFTCEGANAKTPLSEGAKVNTPQK